MINKNQTEFFECQCFTDEHTLRFTFWDDEKVPELYSSVYLCQYHRFFHRIWIALKYIFGYRCKYGHFDSFLMKAEDIDRMIGLLKKFEESWNRTHKNSIK